MPQSSMAKPKITVGGRERVADVAKLYAQEFKTDPVITYLLASMGTSARLAYLREYFDRLLTAAAMNEAVFHEAGDWSAAGVLMRPGYRVDNPLTIIQAGFFPLLWNIGFQGVKRMLFEYQPVSDKCKAKALAGEKKYFYVFFIATREDARGKGACSAIMRTYQTIASRERVPIWLEATTAHSMKIYQSLGWEIVDEMLLGKGVSDADGLPCKGGDGVKTWGMIWRPEGAPKVEYEDNEKTTWRLLVAGVLAYIGGYYLYNKFWK